jgi:hypothetical protein
MHLSRPCWGLVSSSMAILIDEDFVQSKFSARRGVAESENEADAGSRRLNVRNF